MRTTILCVVVVIYYYYIIVIYPPPRRRCRCFCAVTLIAPIYALWSGSQGGTTGSWSSRFPKFLSRFACPLLLDEQHTHIHAFSSVADIYIYLSIRTAAHAREATPHPPLRRGNGDRAPSERGQHRLRAAAPRQIITTTHSLAVQVGTYVPSPLNARARAPRPPAASLYVQYVSSRNILQYM